MKYYLIETDERNKIPYHINKNRAVDIRMLTKEKISQLPMWNVVEMYFPKEGFFPDLLCSPCLLLSRSFIDTVMMYQGEIPYEVVKLWEKKSGINETYFMPVLEEVECIADETQYNKIGNRVVKLVLEQDKISSYAVFKIKDYGENCIVGRMDFVESILRRGIEGIMLTEVAIEKA